MIGIIGARRGTGIETCHEDSGGEGNRLHGIS